MATIKQINKQLETANKRVSDYNKKITMYQERLNKALTTTNKKFGIIIAETDIITQTTENGRYRWEDYSLPDDIKSKIGFEAAYSITDKYRSMKENIRHLEMEKKNVERLNTELQTLIAQKNSEEAKYNKTLDAALRKSMEYFRVVWLNQMITWHTKHFNYIKEKTPVMRELRKRISPLRWYFDAFRNRRNHPRIKEFLNNKEQFCGKVIGDRANRYDQIDLYLDDVKKDLEHIWNEGIVKLTNKCQDYGLEEDKLTVGQPEMTDKGFEVVIEDGKPRFVYARIIWAAECSDFVQPHTRYIVTEKTIK